MKMKVSHLYVECINIKYLPKFKWWEILIENYKTNVGQCQCPRQTKTNFINVFKYIIINYVDDIDIDDVINNLKI